MIRIPRRVRKIPDPNSGSVENPIENLDGFRPDTAWVLLGEPGAGKTTAFQMEAEAVGGECLCIEEFIHLDLDLESLYEKYRLKGHTYDGHSSFVLWNSFFNIIRIEAT